MPAPTAVSDRPAPRRSLPARWGQFLLAMACYGIAIALMIRSGLGLGPWDAFHTGLARVADITVGQASVVAGLGVLAASMAMGVRPAIGTLANMVLLGLASDVALLVIPGAATLSPGGAWAVTYFLLGIVGMGFGTGMYIGAALGAGPRDGMMVALSARLGWPVRRVRTVMEASILAAGYAMGGKLGIGTVLFLVGAGPATQWGMQRFGVVAEGGRASSVDTARPGAGRESRAA